MKIKCSECAYVFEAPAVPRSCPDCYKGPLFPLIEHSFDVGSALIIKASRVEVISKMSSTDGKPYYVVSNNLGWAKVPEEWLEATIRF